MRICTSENFILRRSKRNKCRLFSTLHEIARARHCDMYEVCSENNGNFRFLKKKFIYSCTLMLSPLKQSPLDIMHLCQLFFQTSKPLSNSIFGIAFSSFSDALLMSSMAVKRRPFKVLFIFNRKKSHEAMSGEYGGWGIFTVLFLAKNSWTSNECEQVHCRSAKAMNCFSTNPGVFFGLLHANGVELVGSTPYWPFDLVARIHDVLCH